MAFHPRILDSLLLGLLLTACAETADTRAEQPNRALERDSSIVVVRTQRILDGRGGVLENRDIVVRDGLIEAITAVGERPAATIHDVGQMTVLPGLIDTHVHIGWHFDRTGKTQSAAVPESPQERAYYAAENAWVTLMGGVTTAQSLGSPDDLDLRDAIDRGVLPGPRILTSIAPVTARTGSPEEIEAFVDSIADLGADVIKVFASASIRDGGAPTLTLEQLQAACGRATQNALRSVVHAHGPESAQRAAHADCTTVEHGALLDRQTLELMAELGTYYDPNIDLVFRNYLENRARFEGVGNYNAEGFRQMEAALPRALEAFRTALTVPGLQIVFGTDAVAGAHGRNWQELVYRVHEGGQDPMDAIVSATSRAAAALDLADETGTLAAGMAADLIITEGDPSQDIDALGRIRWVMRAGRMYKVDR